LVLTWATTPTGLATGASFADLQLHRQRAASQIPTNMNLTTLDPSLANCQQVALEPALLMKNGIYIWR